MYILQKSQHSGGRSRRSMSWDSPRLFSEILSQQNEKAKRNGLMVLLGGRNFLKCYVHWCFTYMYVCVRMSDLELEFQTVVSYLIDAENWIWVASALTTEPSPSPSGLFCCWFFVCFLNQSGQWPLIAGRAVVCHLLLLSCGTFFGTDLARQSWHLQHWQSGCC